MVNILYMWLLSAHNLCQVAPRRNITIVSINLAEQSFLFCFISVVDSWKPLLSEGSEMSSAEAISQWICRPKYFISLVLRPTRSKILGPYYDSVENCRELMKL